MMTFKEYLIESTIMSTDALKQAMSDYEQRGIGKPAITKPSNKRLKQMDKRKARRTTGTEEEEVRGRKKTAPKAAEAWTPEFLKRQLGDGQPLKKRKPGGQKLPAMLRRQSGL